MAGEIPELEFWDEKSYKDWLEDQSRSIVVVFVTRAALRTAPFFYQLCQVSRFWPRVASTVILPSFRGLITSLAAGAWPDSAVGKVTSYVAYAANDAADEIDRLYGFAGKVAAAAAFASFVASDAADAASDAGFSSANAASAAMRVSDGFYYANDVTKAIAHAAASDDARKIESGLSAQELAQKPLWPEGILNELSSQWMVLKTELLTLNQDWNVWTDWYEARLRGDPLNKEREIALVTELTEDDWERGPAHVNPKLKEILERFEQPDTLPKQDPLGETFDLDEQGRITIASPHTGQHLNDSQEQQSWYRELREAVANLAAEGHNKLGPLARPVERLQQALPENIGEAVVPTLWSRINHLRMLLARHDAAKDDPDQSFDRLPVPVAASCQLTVNIFNNLALGDDGLRAAEQGAQGPQEEKVIEERMDLIQPVITDAIAQGITDESASEVLNEIGQHKEIMGHGIPDRLQRIQDDRTIGNFLSRAFRAVRDLNATASLIEHLVKWMPKLIEYAALRWPHLQSAIHALLNSLLH